MDSISRDEKFMQIALAQAYLGRGAVEPNPMVGAVLVRDGVEISRGYHERCGRRHAEIAALDAAREARQSPVGSTMYVSLEPCSHHGKTPPCAQALVSAGISRVVVAMVDPDEKVSGRGLAILRDGGVDVSVGICEIEARAMLGPYIKLRTTGRPWVICKWAQTSDGYLALPAGDGRWISSEQSRADVHVLRSQCDGVLIGSGTVVADDPLLTNRSGSASQPTRVILDSQLRISPNGKLISTIDIAPILIYTTETSASSAKADLLRHAGAEILALPSNNAGLDINALLSALGLRNWTNLLVEAGPMLLNSFISAGLADELLVYIAPISLDNDQLDLPRFDIHELSQRISLPEPTQTIIGADILKRYRRQGGRGLGRK